MMVGFVAEYFTRWLLVQKDCIVVVASASAGTFYSFDVDARRMRIYGRKILDTGDGDCRCKFTGGLDTILEVMRNLTP